MTIEALQDDDEIAARGEGGRARKQARLGLLLAPLPKEVKEKEKLTSGVMVEEVLPGPAKKAGIREGDVILSLNNEKITDLDKLDDIVKQLPAGRSVAVLIQREGSPVFLPMRID